MSTTSSDVFLLLIPHLAPPNLLPRKRNRIEAFPRALFDYDTVKLNYKIDPIRIDDHIYSFRNDRFEHGLIVKSYNTDSVSMALSTIPLECFSRFRESGHPRLTAFPKPSEWCFAEGDAVYIEEGLKYKSGIISAIRDDSAEVNTDEGIPCFRSWLQICKAICVGDFVEVTFGIHNGQRGWVDEVNLYSQAANVIQLVDEEKPLSDRCEVCTILNE